MEAILSFLTDGFLDIRWGNKKRQWNVSFSHNEIDYSAYS